MKQKQIFKILVLILIYLYIPSTSYSQDSLAEFSIKRTVTPDHVNINDIVNIQLEIKAPVVTSEIFHPRDVVLLFDVSGSMSDDVDEDNEDLGTKIGNAKKIGIQFVQNLDSAVNISLWKFSGPDNIKMLVPFSKDKEKIIDEINDLSTTSTTYMNTALLQIFDYINENAVNKPPIIIVLTDGAAKDGRLKYDEATDTYIPYPVYDKDYDTTILVDAYHAAIEQYQKNGTNIYTIGFGTDELDTITLRGFAYSTGGKFFYSPTPEDLENAFESIAKTINSTVALQIDEKIPLINDVLPPWLKYIDNSQKVEIIGDNYAKLQGFEVKYVTTSVGVAQKLTWNIPAVYASSIIKIEYKAQVTSSGELSTEVTKDKFNEKVNYGKIIYKGAQENQFFEVPIPDALIYVSSSFSKFGFLIVPRETYIGNKISVKLVALDENDMVLEDFKPQNPIILKADYPNLFLLNDQNVDSIIIEPDEFINGYSPTFYLQNKDSELVAHIFAVDSEDRDNILGKDSVRWAKNPKIEEVYNYKIYLLRKDQFDTSLSIGVIKALALTEQDTLSLYLEDSLELVAIGIDDSLNKKELIDVDWKINGIYQNLDYDFSKFKKTSNSLTISLDINALKAVGIAKISASFLNQFGFQQKNLYLKILDPLKSFSVFFPELNKTIDSTYNDSIFEVKFSTPYYQIYKPFIIRDNDSIFVNTYWNIPGYTDGEIVSNAMQVFYNNTDTVRFNIYRNGYEIHFKIVLKSVGEAGVYPNPVAILSSETYNKATFYVNVSGEIEKINLRIFDKYGNFVKEYKDSDFEKIKPISALYDTYICDKWDGTNKHNNKVTTGPYFAIVKVKTKGFVDFNNNTHEPQERIYYIPFYFIGKKE